MKNLTINKDFLLYNGNKYSWDDVVGIRDFCTPLVNQLSTRGPFAELFIRGGKVIKIHRPIQVDYADQGKVVAIDKNDDFCGLVEELKKLSQCSESSISNWKEWRLLVVPIVLQIVTFLYCLIVGSDMPDLVIKIIIAGIVGLPVGWIWEKKARGKYWV